MPQQILVVNIVDSLREKIAQLRSEGKTIGIVPTMGALHEGHLSLAKFSVERCDFTVATIFVNPTQFAPGEDLDKYPRTLNTDVEMLGDVGVDCVFVPASSDVYPNGYSTAISPPELASVLEGEFRPTHFGGVCTIVLKLFNMVQPDVAFFGQKDFQQAAVLRRMVVDLNVPVEIVVCPIVRDQDGLALSSRNRYLDSEQREIALSLNRTLEFVENEMKSGESDGYSLLTEMRQMLIDAGVTSVDYVAICNPDTLQVMNDVTKPTVVLIAAYVGETRLIDNRLIE